VGLDPFGGAKKSGGPTLKGNPKTLKGRGNKKGNSGKKKPC